MSVRRLVADEQLFKLNDCYSSICHSQFGLASISCANSFGGLTLAGNMTLAARALANQNQASALSTNCHCRQLPLFDAQKWATGQRPWLKLTCSQQ